MKKCLFENLFNKTKIRILKSYLSVNYSPKRFTLERDSKCLCIAPHQDDETIGMGGTLAKYNKNFDVICLTNGAKGFKHMEHKKATEIRAKEFNSAMEVAGIKNYKILDIEDRDLINGYEKFKDTNISDYDYIFLPNIIDQHKDHKAASVLLFRLLKNTRHYKKSLKIAFYEVWSPLTFATSVIGIKDTIETKRKMLEEYKSQCEQRSYFDAALGLSAYRGLAKKQDYAEAFWIMGADEFTDMTEQVYTLLKKSFDTENEDEND